MFTYMLTCRLDSLVWYDYFFTMLFVDFKCWSYMTNSDESYMTYVIYDQLGMVIYDQHNFLTNFAELFMAPTPLLVSTFGDTGERGGGNYFPWHVKVFKFIWYAQKILLNDSILSLYKQYLKNIISMCKHLYIINLYLLYIHIISIGRGWGMIPSIPPLSTCSWHC